MSILDISDVHKSFRQGFWGTRREVLRGLSLSLERGEVYGFLGHNGAGKSTTMKLILGLIRVDSGAIRVFGSEGVTAENRSRIGYLSEEIGLYPHLNAVEMLCLVGELFRIPRRDLSRRVGELLERVGLAPHASLRICHYSKGMRQRLGVATAVLNDPELILLDEPYSGLDPVGRKDLRELLLDLKSQGRTIMLSSHIVPDVEAVCDRVGIITDGCVGRVLDLHEVYSDRTNDLEVVISGASDRIDARDYGGREVHRDRGVVIVRVNGDRRFRALVDDVYDGQGNIVSVRQVKLDLEEVFVKEIEKAPGGVRADRIARGKLIGTQ